ncbi:hypothetical protein K1Y78_47980 [Streptomyces sp. tea 10]|nr:hypothetical protein [Streptomyces sp. tea 10]
MAAARGQRAAQEAAQRAAAAARLAHAAPRQRVALGEVVDVPEPECWDRLDSPAQVSVCAPGCRDCADTEEQFHAIRAESVVQRRRFDEPERYPYAAGKHTLHRTGCREIKESVGKMMEATAALRAGLYGPAQAAAAAVLDPVVNVHMLEFLAYTGRTSKRDTRRHFRPSKGAGWGDATFAEVGLFLVGAGISTVFEWWSRGNGPESFNRNGSAHHADDGSYSPAHAVRAVLIAHAALRWLDDAKAAEQEDEDAA